MIIRKRIILYPSIKNRVSPAAKAVPTSPKLDGYSDIVCDADRHIFDELLKAQHENRALRCASTAVPPNAIGYIIEDTATGEMWGVPISKLKEFLMEHGQFLTDYSAPIHVVIFEDRIHICEPEIDSVNDPSIVAIYDAIEESVIEKRVQVGDIFHIQSAKGIRPITAKGKALVTDIRLAHPELIGVMGNEVENVSRYMDYYL